MKKGLLLFTAFILGFFSAISTAGQTPSVEVPSGAQSSANFDAQRATDAWFATVPPDKKARSDAYFEGGYWLDAVQVVYDVVVLWALLASGWSASMRDRAERMTRRRFLQTAIYAAQFIVVFSIATFPYSLYRDYFREHRYGLANQALGPWFADQLKAFALTIVFGGIAIAILYAILRRTERTWWLWATVGVVVLNIVGTVLFPVFIAPVFNTYTRLNDPAIRDPILSMARANGVKADAVYVVDQSRQTTRISANVSGLFGTERISLNDNLLKQCSLEEIEAVLGHEIGHYVLNHALKTVLMTGIVVFAGFAFAAFGFERIRRSRPQWRIASVGDAAGLPLILLLFSIFQYAATPINNTIIRTDEYEADIFGLNAARQPDAFAAVALKLGAYRKLSPGPVEEFVFFDHPSGHTRIYSAMRFKAEQQRTRP
jgi:STE24 endopeptidase